jgi:hypothetical protein
MVLSIHIIPFNMRLFFLQTALLAALTVNCQLQNKSYSFSTGLDYRQLPIDIEDVPRGPGNNSDGDFYDLDFWCTFSVHARLGINLKKNWQLSAASYARYNHFHWSERSTDVPSAEEIQYSGERKNFKYDIFLDAEKKIRLKKTKERYLFFLAGIGLTNLNTRYDVLFEKVTLPNGTIPEKRFEGTLLRFSPRVSLGYQYEKIKFSLDAYIVEGPDLNNLTSLWTGATISYEMLLRKKKKRP